MLFGNALDPRGRADHTEPASARPYRNQMGTVLAKDKPVRRSRHNKTLITGHTPRGIREAEGLRAVPYRGFVRRPLARAVAWRQGWEGWGGLGWGGSGGLAWRGTGYGYPRSSGIYPCRWRGGGFLWA